MSKKKENTTTFVNLRALQCLFKRKKLKNSTGHKVLGWGIDDKKNIALNRVRRLG